MDNKDKHDVKMVPGKPYPDINQYRDDDDFIKNYKPPRWAQEVVDGMNKAALERKKQREGAKIKKNIPPPRP